MSCDHCSPAAGCAGCGSLSLGAQRGNGLVFALVGQPNSGKSTLFNGLTGSHQHVGNWPGKTVEQKVGEFELSGKKSRVVDLPGAYSLTANSPEEEVTHDFLISGEVDAALVVVDASQLERSLFILADFAACAPQTPCGWCSTLWTSPSSRASASMRRNSNRAWACPLFRLSPPMRSTTTAFFMLWIARFPRRRPSMPSRLSGRSRCTTIRSRA